MANCHKHIFPLYLNLISKKKRKKKRKWQTKWMPDSCRVANLSLGDFWRFEDSAWTSRSWPYPSQPGKPPSWSCLPTMAKDELSLASPCLMRDAPNLTCPVQWAMCLQGLALAQQPLSPSLEGRAWGQGRRGHSQINLVRRIFSRGFFPSWNAPRDFWLFPLGWKDVLLRTTS